VAVALYEGDEKVRIIDLSRNFGHHKAIMTGLSQVHGEKVFLIDCDLEEAPELLPQFCQMMQQTGADVVYGVQATRKGDWFERVSGDLCYGLLNRLTKCSLPRNVITARLMSRRYVESLVRHRDREIFLLGLWAITGYQQVPMTVVKGSKGSTTYNFSRKLGMLVNAITSFSNKPLIVVFYLGTLISSAAVIAAMVLVIRRLAYGVYMSGWPSLIVSIWLLGGLTIFCLGIIGIYLAKVFTETKDRPYTVIRHLYEREGGSQK
jgi:putative glycosyltransferase